MLSANNGNGFVFQSLFESLEDRVLFDGVPDATFILPQADAQEPVPAQVQEVQQADISGPRELILIDAGVQNSDQLLAGILESKPDTILEIRIIESNQDGISQITELLADAEGQYDAIHIVSHGSEGEVNLGNSTLTADNLNSYSDLLASWSGALTDDADLLFYGCDLAGNAEGESFIEAISEITGADVAASDDLTGSADKGGDWELELNVGTVETAAFSAAAFDGVLADKDGDGVDDADDLDDDNDGILDTEEGFSVTTETVDLSGYVGGSLQQTFSVSPDVDVRITFTSTNGAFFGGRPAFDPAGGGFAGGVDDLGIAFDPPNSDPSTVTANVEFFEAGTTNAVVVNGVSTQVSDIDASTPSNNVTGRRDQVTVTAFQGGLGGTAQAVAIDFINPANATFTISGNVATALDDDAAISSNDDFGSISVDTGPIDSLVFTYDEVAGTTNPAARGIAILGNFNVDVPVGRDTDGDGVDDHCDLDSDNDGISDLVESGANAAVVDVNGDGVYDNTLGAGAQVDANGVPLAANGGVAPVDSDGDGLDDYLDLDSDNDGIPDTIEAFPTANYAANFGNDGDVTNDDSDGDGVLDVFDATLGHGGNFTTPQNTDGTDNPDYLDTDSDNDTILDSVESGLAPGLDLDGDGIADNVAPDSYQDPNGVVNNPSADLANQTGDTSEVGYREVVINLVTTKTLASGDASPDEGETVTFQIDVQNTSPNAATNVNLTDLLPAGLTATAINGDTTQGSYNSVTGLFNIGTLAAGSTATLTLEGIVDAGQGGITITNTTTAATADQDDPSTVGDDLNESVTINDAADLVTIKTLASSDATPSEGDTVSFLIEVRNDGAAQASSVSLTDSLPDGITYTADTTSQGSYDAGTGVWTIGTINDGDSATITLTGTVDVGQGGNTITNVTTAATGDQTDPSTAGDDLTEAVVIDNTTDLVTVKTLASSDSTPAEGDTVSFQITVTNDGAAQATNVSLSDSLPTGITYTADTTSQGNYDSATGIWTIGTLNDGAVATITLTGTVDVGEGGNTITNVTTAATGDQPDLSTVGDDLNEAVVIDNTADLVTVKTLTSGNSAPEEGESVTFQIVVTNSGAAQATNVSLNDSLPAGITLTGNTVSQGTYDATGLWAIGTLNNGAFATITLTGTVDVGQGGNTITNMTTAATGDQDDFSIVGDDLVESVIVSDAADLVTVKTLTSGNSTPEEGESVTFQIEVTNNGAAQATNVSLSDSLPTGITLTGNTTSQGTYVAATGLWTIGTLNNTASATITLTGTVDVGQSGNTITNVTTAATGDQTDLSTAGDDL